MTSTNQGPGHTLLVAVMALVASSALHAQRVAKDPHTDQLRALTAQEAQQLASPSFRLDRRQSPPVGMLSGQVDPKPIVHADGSVEQELDTSTLMYSVARRNADGSISRYCVQGADSAQRVMAGKAMVGARPLKEHHHDMR